MQVWGGHSALLVASWACSSVPSAVLTEAVLGFPVGIACIALTFVDENGSPTMLPHGERPDCPKVPIMDLLRDADFESLTAVSKHQPEPGTQHSGRVPLHPPQRLQKVWVLS